MNRLKSTQLFKMIASNVQNTFDSSEIENLLQEFSNDLFALSQSDSDFVEAYRQINSAIIDIECMEYKKKCRHFYSNNQNFKAT